MRNVHIHSYKYEFSGELILDHDEVCIVMPCSSPKPIWYKYIRCEKAFLRGQIYEIRHFEHERTTHVGECLIVGILKSMSLEFFFFVTSTISFIIKNPLKCSSRINIIKKSIHPLPNSTYYLKYIFQQFSSKNI